MNSSTAIGDNPNDWLKGTVCPVREVLAAWSRCELAEVPAGRNWDIVRAAFSIGMDALGRMRRAGYAIGPVMLTAERLAIEILVPPGVAEDWDLPGTVAVGEGKMLRCPDPNLKVPWFVDGRTWLVAPGTASHLTDSDVLYRALAAALRATGGSETSDTEAEAEEGMDRPTLRMRR